MRPLAMVRLLVLIFICVITDTTSSAQTFHTILSFDKPNGLDPVGPLVLVKDGNFYGTTLNGGTDDFGTVFKVTKKGTLTTLYSFLCSPISCAAGYSPQALTLGMDGNFYGVAELGGINGHGTVFKITHKGVLTTLYSFCAQQNCTDGEMPNGPLVLGRDGNFYGTTYSGGSSGGVGGAGTVFKVTPGGTVTTLYSFCSEAYCADGQLPVAGLVRGRDGNFYGTTPDGGKGIKVRGSEVREYDLIADWYASERIDQTGVPEATTLASSIPRGSLVLDVGCGNGIPITRALLSEGHQVVGLDSSSAMLARFKQNCPVTFAVRGIVQSCPFADGVFDAVVAWGVMFHQNPEDAIRAIQNVSRILKRGAPFLFTSGDVEAFEANEGKMNDVTFRYFSYGVHGYRRILSDHDLTLVDVHADSGNNTYYLAKKADRLG